jgi:hypothetical protein
MQGIGHARRPLIGALALAPWGALGALAAVIACWGFTVDDALIPARYAHHVASGAGYRFNGEGPASDGVTPLPFPWILAPLARGSVLDAWLAARVIGGVAWVGAACVLDGALARASARAGRGRATTLALLRGLLLVAMPVHAHATSGMETALATALATVAACAPSRPRFAALSAGLAASLRPEMVVWSLTLTAARGASRRGPLRAWIECTLLALGPFLACAIARVVAFGSAAPLAVSAKPSDASHGLLYVAAALVVSGLVALLPSRAWLSRGAGDARALLIAFVAHLMVLVIVGGDWMPYARLLVPVWPSALLMAALAARASSIRGLRLRLSLAIVLAAALSARHLPEARRVVADRMALIESARPLLASASRVAALDVGWLGAATEAPLVDLAGLTDREIAALPGGHTSKRVDVAMLLDRRVDAIVLYEAGPADALSIDSYVPARGVEARLARSPLLTRHFEVRDRVRLGSHGSYLLLGLRTTPRSNDVGAEP